MTIHCQQGGFRRYVHEQLFLSLKPMLLKAAQELIPKLRSEHIELSEKVGIRSQVFNRREDRIEDDFSVFQDQTVHTF